MTRRLNLRETWLVLKELGLFDDWRHKGDRSPMRYFSALLLVPALLIPSVASGQRFLVLGELFFTNQPDNSYFEGYGIEHDHVAYQAQLGAPAVEGMVRAEALKSLGESYNGIVQMDYEYYGPDARLMGNAKAHAEALKLCETLRWFKSEEPTLSVAFFEMVPLTDLDAYLNPTDFAAWKAANDQLQVLADSVDYLCPSLYAYYADTAQYIGYATAVIREAKRMAKGKPVYPYISPHYMPGLTGMPPSDSSGHDVSHDYFATILRAITNAGADGAIIFAGTYPTFGNHVWDSSAGWWTATKEFLASLDSGNVSSPGPPLLIWPSKAATNVPPTFISRWRKSPGATSYHLQLADNITFQNPILNDSTTTDTLRHVGPLSNTSRYYWRVSAKAASTWSSFSISADFLTDVPTFLTDVPKPNAVALNQNYPNPFNPTTTISFGLPSSSFVTLKVFDLLGREVASLVSEQLSAGYHSRQWNGGAMPSGVYFYRLQVGSFTETRRLVFLK